MLQSPRHSLWILALMGLSLILLGCAAQEPALYTVDRIEGHTAILLPRAQGGDPIAVPYNLLSFAREGDIISVTDDPTCPYALDQAATAKAQTDIATLLARLEKQSESAK